MHCINNDSSDTEDSETEVQKTPTKKKGARKSVYICSAPMEEALQRYSYKTVFLNVSTKFTGGHTC